MNFLIMISGDHLIYISYNNNEIFFIIKISAYINLMQSTDRSDLTAIWIAYTYYSQIIKQSLTYS